MEKKEFIYTRVQTIHMHEYEVQEGFINKELDKKLSAEKVIYCFVNWF